MTCSMATIVERFRPLPAIRQLVRMNSGTNAKWEIMMSRAAFLAPLIAALSVLFCVSPGAASHLGAPGSLSFMGSDFIDVAISGPTGRRKVCVRTEQVRRGKCIYTRCLKCYARRVCNPPGQNCRYLPHRSTCAWTRWTSATRGPLAKLCR